MPFLTPGVLFLGRGVRLALVPALFVVAVKRFTGTPLPTWLLALATLLAIPVLFAMRVMMISYKHRREAAAMGARLAPELKGTSIGNIDILKTMMHSAHYGYPGDAQADVFEQLGPTYNIRVLWDDLLFTVDPDNIKTILATDFNNYVKGEKFRLSMDSVLGTGVFNSDADMWKFHRGMTRPFFSKDRISHFDTFERHSDGSIELAKKHVREGYPLDIQDLVARFTLDSATEFLFGSCVNSLSAGLPYPSTPAYHSAPKQDTSHPAEDFARAFLQAQYAIAERSRQGWTWPLAEIFEDKTIEPMRMVNKFLDPILADAVEQHRRETDAGEKKIEDVGENATLLSHLVNFTSDPTVLKDETLNILIAARDTTATTLTSAVYCLALYPHILTRLREEVLTHVGPTARPTYDGIRDMKYLRAFINETLRLFPAVPFNIRESVNATTWPSRNSAEKPIYVPAGTSVPYSVFLMHRRKDLWGPDAEEFDPDRFIDDRLKKYLTHNPFIFIPFNAGPRICLGQQFAYNEMSFMIIRLLQNFSSFSLATDAQPADTLPPADWANAQGRKGIEKFWPKCHLTLYAHGGLWVNMVEAEETVKA